MKFFLLALFVAAATAAPTPLEDDGGPVEVIVNGVAEGEPLEIGDLLGIKVQEHNNGQIVSATNVLHPFTAVGIAEAAAAAAAENEVESVSVPESVILPMPVVPEAVIPEPIILPQPIVPEIVIPEPIVLPQPADPEVVIPEPIVLPQPVVPEVVIPEPIVLPQPVAPEVVIPEPIILPQPVVPEVVIPEPIVLPQPVAPEVVIPEPVVVPEPVVPEAVSNGELFNDGVVQVTLNTPQDATVLSTLSSWFSMVLNYFSEGAQTSHQIV